MASRRRAIQTGALLAACTGLSFDAGASGTEGTWSGVLEAGALRLRLKLEIAADGSATLFSIDQGREPRPGAVKSSATPDHIEIEFPTIRATFVARTVAPDRMDGTWRQGGGSLPLVFERGEAALGPLPALRPLTRERLAALRLEAGSPGMAAASARRGTADRLLIDGERQIGTGIAITVNDQWHLGSITKSMTATLVGRLVEAGAVHWDDTVGETLRDAAPQMNEAYRPATFRHLLSHRAGLQGNIPLAEFAKFSRQIADAREERKAFARLALSMAPQGPMTSTFEYSNNGYVVVGAMLEVRLGRSWEELMQAQVFGPLGLASAGFGAPGRAGAIDQPVGHAIVPPDTALKPFPVGGRITDNVVALGPAGRVHMNLKDLLRYLAGHRDATDYLKRDTWRTLHTPPFGGGYALGWEVRKDGALSHSGSNTLWYAHVLVDPSHGIAAVAAANDGDAMRVAPALSKALNEVAVPLD
jgi:CubicO group peptidase (beta-lactamase class C family)